MDCAGKVRTVFTDPLIMSDKTAWTHSNAFFTLWPTARAMGHCGLCVSHHVWDGAIKRPCERHARQRFAALELHTEDEESNVSHELMKLLSWFTCVSCFAHHGHNALKWALSDFISSRDTMKSCWVVFASLRNSVDLLVKYLPQWLHDRVRFADGDEALLREMWQLLGEEDKWVNILVNLQLRFADGCLYVACKFEGDETCIDQVTAALLHRWRFRAWSDSRWCGIGPSCRSLLGCVMCGLQSLVDTIMACPRASKYYIQGFKNLSHTILKMMTLIACSSRVSENFLELVLSDDRVPRNLQNK